MVTWNVFSVTTKFKIPQECDLWDHWLVLMSEVQRESLLMTEIYIKIKMYYNSFQKIHLISTKSVLQFWRGIFHTERKIVLNSCCNFSSSAVNHSVVTSFYIEVWSIKGKKNHKHILDQSFYVLKYFHLSTKHGCTSVGLFTFPPVLWGTIAKNLILLFYHLAICYVNMPQYLHKKSPTSCWYQDNVYFRTSSTIWLLRKCTVHSYKKKPKHKTKTNKNQTSLFTTGSILRVLKMKRSSFCCYQLTHIEEESFPTPKDTTCKGTFTSPTTANRYNRESFSVTLPLDLHHALWYIRKKKYNSSEKAMSLTVIQSEIHQTYPKKQ